MTTLLTDRAALSRNRMRAAKAPVTFLHELARDEVQDRVSLVKKSFKDVAIIGGFPEFWLDAIQGAMHVPDSDALDLEPNSKDLVIHAMSLHWSNDPVGQMVQARHALRPDGLFLAVFLGGETLKELRTSFAQAESDLYGSLSARVAPMGEIRDLGGLLQRAGFTLPVADRLPLRTSYETPIHLMHELRFMGEANALATRRRRFMQRKLLKRACDIYCDIFSSQDGRIEATFELIVLTGWAPASTQPRPLRPGSAQTRLADALGTDETPLRD
jgi:SAM-dependent methyltransferase